MAYGASESVGYRDQPQLIFRGGVSRKTFRKRLRWAIIAMLASVGVIFMLNLPQITTAIENDMPEFIPNVVGFLALTVGQLVAGAILVVSVGRAMVNAVKMLKRKTERMKFFDVGFMWEREGDQFKYNWNAVKTIIEDPHAFVLFKRPLFEWGSITIKIRDGNEFVFNSAHGSMFRFIQRVQPHYAAEISTRMGQLVRSNKQFKVHPDIAVSSVGLTIAQKRQILWERLNLQHDARRNSLTISMIDENGAIKPVAKYKTKTIDNFAAFMELAETTIENTQRSPIYT